MKRLGLVLAFFLVFSLPNSFSQEFDINATLNAAQAALDAAEAAYEFLISEMKGVKDGVTRIQDKINLEAALYDAEIAFQAVMTEIKSIKDSVVKIQDKLNLDTPLSLYDAEIAYTSLLNEIRSVKFGGTVIQDNINIDAAEAAYESLMIEIKAVKDSVAKIQDKINLDTALYNAEVAYSSLMNELKGVKDGVIKIQDNMNLEAILGSAEIAYNSLINEIRNINVGGTGSHGSVNLDITDAAYNSLMNEIRSIKAGGTVIQDNINIDAAELAYNSLMKEFLGIRNELQGARNDLQTVRTEIQGVRTEILGVKSEIQNLSGQQRLASAPSPVRGNLTPFRAEFIKNVEAAKESFGALDFYLSRPLVLISKPDSKPQIVNGTLVFSEGNKTESLRIPENTKGRYIKHGKSQDGRDFFEISFDSTPLQFFRNPRTDTFVLEMPAGSPSSFEGPSPSLAIYYSGDSNREGPRVAQGAPMVRQPSAQAAFANRPNVNEIIGTGRSRSGSIVAYIRSQNPSADLRTVESIVNIYIREAELEGINHDIAIAQMCYATNFLRNQQRLIAHNYGGLLDAKLPTREMGIRAHIQHLKGYSSVERPRNIVDPRYDVLVKNHILGTVTTLDQLYATWAPLSSDYGNRIDGILRELRRL